MSRVVGLRFCGRAELCLAAVTPWSLALCWLVGWTALAAAQGMALPGQFGVNPTGAATYSIPIAVPPGTAGMTPSLALAYNSQGGNGVLGMGWSLEGLASIGRCPKTIAQDGVRGSVNYDANDRFCLDGQRLISISGTYGADGTEYRTEIESFSKIISRGVAGTGPAWFEVRTKSGQRMEFGNTTDSRVLAQGKTTARDWVVNKVSDTKGNYFTVTYINDTTNGQVYPSRIDYTGNAGAGLQPYNSVRFVYDTARPDVVPAYHVGSLLKTTVLLTNAQTYAGANLVADYRLTYIQGPTTGRSQLTNVTLCDGTGTCLPATTFGWQNGTLTPTILSNVGGLDGTVVDYGPVISDFNGDGLADILWNRFDPGANVLWMGTGNGNFTVITNLPAYSRFKPIPGDFNRDGKTDIWWQRPEHAIQQWTSKGDGTFAITLGPSRPSPADKWSLALLGDANGDGRADVAWLFSSSSSSLWFWLTNADGITVNGGTTSAGQFGVRWIQGVHGPDFNGDGVTDILFASPGGPEAFGGGMKGLSFGKGDGTFSPISGADSSVDAYISSFLDVNGDGKTDILWDNADVDGRSQGKRILWLSKGDGTFAVQANLGGLDGTVVWYVPILGDFNGDGKTDILWDSRFTGDRARSSGIRVLWLGKGDGNFTVISNFGGQDGTLVGYVPILADFNGDGKTDILWDKAKSATDTSSAGQRVLWLSDGVAADLMTSITSGIGANVAITYKPLTNSTVYTRDNTAADPLVGLVDLQGPISVVSRVDGSNGIGGTVSTGYAYAGAKADQDGRGFLSFRQATVTDLQTNLVQTTTYRQDFPYIGLAASETKKLGAATLNTTANTYGATMVGSTRYQVFLTQSQATSADLDGSPLPTVTSAYQYDTHGNATQIVVSATDGHAKTTTNTYTNDTANWLLGRLTRATVASLITQPGPPPPPPPLTEVYLTISGGTNNLNLWNYLVAKGLAKAGTPGSWTITIANGVVIGSSSTGTPALDTGAFPAGSTLKLISNGTIVGAGGNGGNGGSITFCEWGELGTPGAPGGPALRVQLPVMVVNNGGIWGGGGGGGGSTTDTQSEGSSGEGGGGGAGRIPGVGGFGYSGYAGSGTLSSGGSWGGGGPGQAGAAGPRPCGFSPAAGGAPGAAVIGNSFITWTTVGDRRGPLN